MLHRFIYSFIRQIVSRKLNSFREESLECTCQGLNLHLFGIEFLCILVRRIDRKTKVRVVEGTLSSGS
jgi:hypothetical protein